MRSINTEILLRNRRVDIDARTRAFDEAVGLVDEILALFSANGAGCENPARLQRLMPALVDRLFHARYYARMSVGGNNASVPAEISGEERAFVDHVETMYSYSRSINRFLRHEILIESFIRERPAVAAALKTYLAEIRSSDFNLIYINLVSMRNRLNLYNRYMHNPAARVALTPSEATEEHYG